MTRFILTWLGNCVGLVVAAALIPSIGYGHSLGTVALAGLILGFVNFALRPLVILVTLPAVILSLGFALLLINAAMLWVTSELVTGLHLGGFYSTVGAAVVIWLVNLALRPWRGGRRDRGRRERRGSTRAAPGRGR